VEIKSKNAKRSFYGDEPLPKEADLQDDSSTVALNYDLYGYYEIYSQTTPSTFLEALEKNKLCELSPPQVLFLLEFQMQPTTTSDGQKVINLNYVPHRFYHR
jgi:hypothetical protein